MGTRAIKDNLNNKFPTAGDKQYASNRNKQNSTHALTEDNKIG